MMVIVPLQHHASDIWTSSLGYNSTLPILHFIGQHRPKYVPTGLHYSEGLTSRLVPELPIQVILGRMWGVKNNKRNKQEAQPLDSKGL